MPGEGKREERVIPPSLPVTQASVSPSPGLAPRHARSLGLWPPNHHPRTPSFVQFPHRSPWGWVPPPTAAGVWPPSWQRPRPARPAPEIRPGPPPGWPSLPARPAEAWPVAAAAATSEPWSPWRTPRAAQRRRQRQPGSSRAGGGRCERDGAGGARPPGAPGLPSLHLPPAPAPALPPPFLGDTPRRRWERGAYCFRVFPWGNPISDPRGIAGAEGAPRRGV